MTPEGLTRMPVLFVGHGSPMNAVEDNEFSRAWTGIGKKLPRPKAILCISAHWETEGAGVTAMERPRTIHDFYGFPPELFAQEYPAPGSPRLARRVAALVPGARLDTEWGLDHGTWSVLKRMYPKADIPVVQLGLDRFLDPEGHYRVGARLAPLREEGVLVLGSGNIVHNLMLADPSAAPYDWAVKFDERVGRLIEAQDTDALVHYDGLGEPARLAIPTNEHYLPMLYALALRTDGDRVRFFAERIVFGSVSMRSFIIGPG